MLLQMAIFIFMAELYSIVCIYVHMHTISSEDSGHLGCFYVLALVDSAAMNVKIGTEIRAVQLQAKEC